MLLKCLDYAVVCNYQFVSVLCTSLFCFLTLAAADVTQVHLGLTNSVANCPHGLVLSFASTKSAPMTIHYAAASSAVSVVSQYTVAGNCAYTSPYLHSAYLCNLKSRTRINYSIEGERFSASFVTPPSPESEGPTVLSVVGDVGNDQSLTTFASLSEPVDGVVPSAVIVAGDFAYANGFHKIWDEYFEKSQPIFSQVPLLGINGNHETVEGSGVKFDRPECSPENYLAYIHRVMSPLNADAKAALRTYYSIDVGLVHIVFLDDYVGSRGRNKTVGSDMWKTERQLQLDWITRDLEAVNRTNIPWVVVFKHNPFYNTWDCHQCTCGSNRFRVSDIEQCWEGNYDKSVSEPQCGQQAKLESLYVENGVNLVVAGHVHAYERTAPIASNQIDIEKGVVYITVGTGGHGFCTKRLEIPIPEWSTTAMTNILGGVRLAATRATMKVEYIDAKTSKSLDSFELTSKARPWVSEARPGVSEARPGAFISGIMTRPMDHWPMNHVHTLLHIAMVYMFI
jgi:hypothetical protein